ncbi:fructosamine kinase family protein [Aquirufa sp. OSTEICH-129V]|jgi:protein-ribulosamine 3-kinase|uniref:Fructosamine kinase family protein n=1 Tax=Aquirufa avitistagni TaxID=3104728 RepID=A0ABW6DB76_9BACT
MSQQSQEQYQFIAQILSKHTGESTQIDDFQFFYGGNFNLAVRLRVKNTEYFIKWTQGDHQGLFEAEAKNLQMIHATGAIQVPQVLGVGQLDEKEYLMMECIESADKHANYWHDFGEKLAHLHKNTSSLGHGLDYTNFIGAATQENSWKKDGVEFFIENRLNKQVDRALYDRKITPELAENFQRLYEKLPDLLPHEAPALIHGDLWSGNAMVNEQGLVTLVDPCCYYGLREAELAFTTMFGGFDTKFYEAYHATFPIEKGFHERIPLYNLYPLMVHVNLFGEGYLPAVNKILASY